MACSVILTQGIKSGLKTMFSEPRPFVQEIVQNSDMSTDDFYAQKRHERKKWCINIIKKQRQNRPHLIG